jgi:oligoendopeptidase F
MGVRFKEEVKIGNMKVKIGVSVALIGSLSLASAVYPQDRGPTAPPFSIDQARYFATPEIEQAEYKQRVDEAMAFPTVVPADPKALSDYLHAAEALLAQLQRHSAYLYLRASRDFDDRADADATDRADDAVNHVTRNVQNVFRALGRAEFAKDASADPTLHRFEYLLTRANRDAPHELPRDEQYIVDELSDPAAANLWSLYQQTLRSTAFAKKETPAGQFDVRKDARLLNANPDRAIRRSAWEARMTAYASREDIYAGILLGVVRLLDRVARLKHFSDAPSMVYFSRDLGRRDVAEALAAVESHAGVLKGYQRMQAGHFAATTGIADVHIWDMPLPEAGLTLPRMSFDQTRAAAMSALAPLGNDYVGHFRDLLDPANGRLDIGAEQGKRTNGGFSVRAPGVPTGLFIVNYGAGLLGDSRVILHEGGHAVHEQFMLEANISPFYTQGPNWMFEAFATLNEFLLYDYLYKSARDPRAQAYYLQALIDDMVFSIFGSAEEGTLEQSIYDGVAAGQIKNAADLDALTLSIWSKYEIWPASEPKMANYWITRSLMVQDPLYQVNYLYAGMLAIKMYEMVGHDAAAFQKRYLALLRNGFYAPPGQLLQTFFGRDVSQAELVQKGMGVLDERIKTLGLIYRTIEKNR